jgi:short-subunit dehydrogenase
MQKVLITGVSSGIGKYLSDAFCKDFDIIWVSRSSISSPEITYISGDLWDIWFLQDFAKNISDLDYLVLNAWVWYFDHFEKIWLSEHQEQIQTNLLSPILLTSLLIWKIKKWIIFIGSVSSKKSGKFWASYSASKFGLRGFAMNLKNEYPKLQIHFLNPKIIDTWFHKNSKVEIVGKYQATSLESVWEVMQNIFEKKEKRFEIDL